MTEEEILITIYKIIIKRGFVTEELLLQEKVSHPTTIIKELIDKGILIRTNKGKCKLSSVEDLYNYGTTLFLEHKIYQANKCYERCYKLDPNHRRSCLQIFLLNIKKGNYNYAFKIYENLIKIDIEKHYEDNKLYLYLLCIITECPKEYIEEVKNIQLEDILVSSSFDSSRNINIENEMRQEIFDSKLPHAMKLYNDIRATNDSYNIERGVLKNLLSLAIESENKRKATLLQLIKQKQYQEALTLLENKSKTRKLTIQESDALTVIKSIINLLENNQIAKPYTMNTNSIYRALQNHDYELALKLNNEYLELKGINKEENILNILLVEITTLIKKLKPIQIDEFYKEVKDIELTPSKLPSINIRMADLDIMSPNELLLEAKHAYNTKSFNLCISLCKRIIAISNNPPQEIYMMLGLSYNNIGNKSEAINYLSLSKEIYNATNQRNNQSNSFEQSTYDIIHNIFSSYTELQELAYYFKSENISYKDAIEKHNVTETEILIIKLIHAVYCYIENNEEESKKILEEVSNDKNLTSEILIIIKEILEYIQPNESKQMRRIRKPN